jgi:hypothetical protein
MASAGSSGARTQDPPTRGAGPTCARRARELLDTLDHDVERWLERRPRVHFHFTPPSASWMNMVEIWFSILTKQRVRRGVYHDVSG